MNWLNLSKGLRGIGARGLGNNKGWLRIIEIALAATLVFSFFLFINNFESKSKSSRPETDRYLLHQIGEDALRSYDLVDSDSDDFTDLRTAINTSNWAGIGAYLNSTLGSGIGYSLYFYNANDTYPAGDPKFKTGAIVQPLNRDIVSVYYIVAGDGGISCSDSSACALKLELWQVK